jgi:hypothetical protein
MTEPGLGINPDYAGALGGVGGTVPSGCDKHKLTPQELALEFMIFNLSSCLVPPGMEPVKPKIQ